MLDELEHELERVRAYRSDVPEPDDAAVAEARLLLMRAIAHEPRTAAAQRGRSGQAFFVSLFRHYGRNSRRSGRGRGLRPVRSRERLRRLQRRRRFALAGGLATVGVAGVLGLTTAATPVSALAEQMNQLAKVAASQDWRGIPGPGQYLYTASEGLTSADTYLNGESCTVSQVEHRQSWIATDGSGAINDTRDQSQFTSTADQAACAAMKITDPSSQNSSWSNRFPVGGLSFPTNNWQALSTDPATLLKQVHELDGGPDTPAEWFVNVTDFMRESDVPPTIRAALYQALPLIPGVRLLGAQTDPTGQSGLGVGLYKDGQLSAELIFDQQSGRMLAEEYYDVAGTRVEWTAYTAQEIVDSVPDYKMAPAPQQPTQIGGPGRATITTATGTPTASGTTTITDTTTS